jgi:phosphatidylinositol alpha-1,6-mannosyltransferase
VNGALLVTSNFPPKIGGSCTLYSNLYCRRRPDDVAILTGEAANSAECDRDFGREIVRMSFESRRWTKPFEWIDVGVRRFPAAKRILKRRGFREIHCGSTFPEGVVGLLAKKLLGVRVVQYVLGEDAEFFRHCRVEAPIQRWMMRSADRVIAISTNTARICRELGATDANLRVIEPGVDVSAFKPDPEGAHKIRAKHSVNGDPLLVTVGRLQKRKGHDRVLQALPQIRQRFPNVKYLVVGDSTGAPSSDADDLHRIVDSLALQDAVTFVGGVPFAELPAYYSAADLFVMPNRQIGGDVEGFGITFLEAAACGKTCIAGDSGGAVDAVLNEKTGLLVNGDDPGSVASGILNLLSDPAKRRRFEIAAEQRVAEFSWDRIHERFEAALVD